MQETLVEQYPIPPVDRRRDRNIVITVAVFVLAVPGAYLLAILLGNYELPLQVAPLSAFAYCVVILIANPLLARRARKLLPEMLPESYQLLMEFATLRQLISTLGLGLIVVSLLGTALLVVATLGIGLFLVFFLLPAFIGIAFPTMIATLAWRLSPRTHLTEQLLLAKHARYSTLLKVLQVILTVICSLGLLASALVAIPFLTAG